MKRSYAPYFTGRLFIALNFDKTISFESIFLLETGARYLQNNGKCPPKHKLSFPFSLTLRSFFLPSFLSFFLWLSISFLFFFCYRHSAWKETDKRRMRNVIEPSLERDIDGCTIWNFRTHDNSQRFLGKSACYRFQDNGPDLNTPAIVRVKNQQFGPTCMRLSVICPTCMRLSVFFRISMSN